MMVLSENASAFRLATKILCLSSVARTIALLGILKMHQYKKYMPRRFKISNKIFLFLTLFILPTVVSR
jgi:hypothetical protein